jgi:hypothetical protein
MAWTIDNPLFTKVYPTGYSSCYDTEYLVSAADDDSKNRTYNCACSDGFAGYNCQAFVLTVIRINNCSTCALAATSCQDSNV